MIIVIEGWNAAGITMSTKEIIQSLDPRGFTLHATDKANDEERARPFMWRFWTKTHSKGRIALFARSWYSRALAEKLSSIGWKKSLKDDINSITVFERQLSDSGAIIIKFFLHISKDEQKLRLLERERNPLTAWLVTPSIWDFHHNYAAQNFQPCPGRITTYHPPGGAGVRVDTHIYDGYTVPPYYDSLLAKIIVHGNDRAEALARMHQALESFIIEGVTTTVPRPGDEARGVPAR